MIGVLFEQPHCGEIPSNALRSLVILALFHFIFQYSQLGMYFRQNFFEAIHFPLFFVQIFLCF